MKKKKLILYMIGGIFLIYGLILMLIGGLNAGHLAVGGIGLLLLAGGWFYEKVPAWIKGTVLGLLGAWLCLAAFLFGYGWHDTADYREDAVIVLGAGLRGEEPGSELRSRLDQAIAYHAENPDALIVVSGGLGDQEQISEAEAMARYLIKAGLPEAQIIKEDQSTKTYENFLFSKAILDERLGEEYRIAFISNDFHLFRAGLMAADVGFEEVHRLHGATPIGSVLPCGLRECLALAKFIVFQRG